MSHKTFTPSRRARPPAVGIALLTLAIGTACDASRERGWRTQPQDARAIGPAVDATSDTQGTTPEADTPHSLFNLDADTTVDNGDSEAGAGDASCGDPTTDPRNCGACGHTCLPGACQAGACGPLPPGVLATGQPNPSGIVVDANNVYWVDLGPGMTNIMKCAKSGCGNDPTVLATGAWNTVPRIAVDAENVYWIGDDQVLECAVTGCNGSPTVLSSGQGMLSDMAVDSTNVYFASEEGEEVLRCAVSGCNGNPTVLFPGLADAGSDPLFAIAVDSTNVYFASRLGFVHVCPVGGCSDNTIQLLTGAIDPLRIALDTTSVYFMGNASVEQCPKSGCNNGSTTLVSDLSNLSDIAVDGTNVYFTEWGSLRSLSNQGSGRVAKCAVGGCNNRPTPIVGYVNVPRGIAVDSTSVYFTDYGATAGLNGSVDGRVVVVPK